MASIETFGQHDRFIGRYLFRNLFARYAIAAGSAKAGHDNNLGAIRLVLAYAVIFSHAPEMLYGNKLREPLISIGSQLTLGGLAVDGFFIISGYLVASSYLSARSLPAFLISRILRIYPAFILASLVCIFLVGPLAGGRLSAVGERGWLMDSAKLFLLHSPELPGAFATLHFPALDGAMWTIRYEFYCYLLVGLLGVLGALNRRMTILLITAFLYAATVYFSFMHPGVIHPGLLHKLIFGIAGDPMILLVLVAIFMSGACYRLFREKIVLSGRKVASLALICGGLLFVPRLAEIAVAPVLTCVILWAGLQLKSRFLQATNNKYDFSYGVYLYAWPIASLLILYTRPHSTFAPIMITGVTIILATFVGGLSWYALEKPILKFKRNARSQIQRFTSLELNIFAGTIIPDRRDR